MDHEMIIRQLSQNSNIVKEMTDRITVAQARWKPSADRWSVLEIINHMIDEERDDFRKRLTLSIEAPDRPWPPIDPEGWARERDYNERDFNTSRSVFLDERSVSIARLKDVAPSDWTSNGLHPKRGPMSAEIVLANWLAHDLLHIRQIVTVRYAHLADAVAPVSLEYAGSL